jgi:hypothetical protein
MHRGAEFPVRILRETRRDPRRASSPLHPANPPAQPQPRPRAAPPPHMSSTSPASLLSEISRVTRFSSSPRSLAPAISRPTCGRGGRGVKQRAHLCAAVHARAAVHVHAAVHLQATGTFVSRRTVCETSGVFVSSGVSTRSYRGGWRYYCVGGQWMMEGGAPTSSCSTRLERRNAGSGEPSSDALVTMATARPSAIAVLPTPGGWRDT